jgi:hypothetical protein
MNLRMQEFLEDNKEYLLIGIVVMQISLFGLIALKDRKSEAFTFKAPTIASEGELKQLICYYGFKNLSMGNPNKDLFEKETANALSQVDDVFPSDVEKIFSPKILRNNICEVIAKDNEGLRVFKLTLEKGAGTFGYLITGIEERELSGNEEEI